MKNDSAAKVKMTSLDELLGVSPKLQGGNKTALQEVTPLRGRLTELPLGLLHTFHSHPYGHPFRVQEDARMQELVESIRENGVLQPVIVRPDTQHSGEYELISGHRRTRAAELAGCSNVPVVIQDLDDNQAIIIMTDSNLQRDDILDSEIAWAYRMKYDALKAMGADNGRNDALLAQELGKSRCTLQRYIRLTYLTPELLRLVDDKKLAKNPAADLSYLSADEQALLYEVMRQLKVCPDGAQAQQLKNVSREGPLTQSVIRLVLEKEEAPAKLSISTKRLRTFFPEEYTVEKIEGIVYGLLEEWKQQHMNTV